MGKNKKILSEDTVIVWGIIPVGEYRRFFTETIGKEFADDKNFQTWLFTQSGKTLKEAAEDHFNPTKPNDIEELLAERRFNMIYTGVKAAIRRWRNASISAGNVQSAAGFWKRIQPEGSRRIVRAAKLKNNEALINTLFEYHEMQNKYNPN